ncbi:MAG: hypothetical protein V7K67_06625 [Nostoc sp.]
MKLENFTDLHSWAVEQWQDAELGDSRRTVRLYRRGIEGEVNQGHKLYVI